MFPPGAIRRQPVDREAPDPGRAQRVARRSIELAAPPEGDEIGGVALELMRAADHDPAMLQHALVVCRSLSRDDPTDERVKRAIRLLKQVTTFLGVPPHLFDAGLTKMGS